MVLIHSDNGSWGLPLIVRLHLDVRRRRLFLAWNTSSSSSLPISSYGWHYTPPNSWSNMERRGQPRGEIIKWFGIIILATRFKFGDRASLWSTVYQSNYRSVPTFGKTIMNRPRFDILWRHVWWSHQPYVWDEGTVHEPHWWKFVEYFVTNFNDYHTQLFSPSDIICADESISRWYGKGGHIWSICICWCMWQ